MTDADKSNEDQPSKTSTYGITIEHLQTAEAFTYWGFYDVDDDALTKHVDQMEEHVDKLRDALFDVLERAQRQGAAFVMNEFAVDAKFGVSWGDDVKEGTVELRAFDSQVVLTFDFCKEMIDEAKTIMGQGFRDEWVKLLRKLADDIEALPPPEE